MMARRHRERSGAAAEMGCSGIVTILAASNPRSWGFGDTLMKMYILIKDDVPPGFAVLAAAHASLAAYLEFEGTTEVAEWLAGPFYKTICRVTEAEFEKAKECTDHVILTESALENGEVAIAFKPREEWPKSFKFFRLYR